MTRVTTFGDTTRFESHLKPFESRCTKRFVSELVLQNLQTFYLKSPIRLHTMKWTSCVSVMINIGAYFLFPLYLLVVL